MAKNGPPLLARRENREKIRKKNRPGKFSINDRLKIWRVFIHMQNFSSIWTLCKELWPSGHFCQSLVHFFLIVDTLYHIGDALLRPLPP